MNKKKYIWDFLEDLQKNNSKDWMDENRSRYHTAKGYWLEELDLILQRLAKHDTFFDNFKPKDTITRINNNRMFHPDKPVYKGSFSFAPISKTDQVMQMYFAFGPESMVIGGGMYRPEKESLKSIRDAIDYKADDLLKIIEDKKLVKLFGGLAEDPNQLKRCPKGYDKEHPHVDLLRRKSFTASYTPEKEYLLNNDLADVIEEAYLTLRPLVSWLNNAVSV